tara:strand:- start:455 stop:637 length:183 start_codon:yes stop_codon:yes gene_type:complete
MKILTAKYESGITDANSVIRVTYEGQPSGSIMNVPVNADNMDYQLIQEWVAAGNTVEAAS